MNLKNVEQVREYCKSNSIKMIDFKMIDIDGKWRHITIPADNFDNDTMKYGIGFDGSNYGFSAVEKSDMVFIPDISTANIDPFCATPTLSMLGDVCVIDTPNNYPFDQYPKNVALAAVKYMQESGIADKMIIGPEFEFHIFDDVKYSVKENEVSYSVHANQAEWNSDGDYNNGGYLINHKGGYHIAPPQDVNNDLRTEISLLLDEWGVPVKYHHHEVGGCGQQEIEVALDEMVKMADSTMIIKYLIKNCAFREGKTATLMPKPVYNEAGNGMHVHMLLVKDGKPLFYDENGYSQLSDTAHYFIGGLLKHARSLCGLTNPSTNSYKRLVPGFEAPVVIGYATANRSAVVRIPAYAKSPMHKRFELRNPDATCNPYYAYAAILMAGLDGIKNKIDPRNHNWGPFDFNLFDLTDEDKSKIQSLPTSLNEALNCLEEDNEYLKQGGVFSDRLLKLWISRKRKEAKLVDLVPHPAEIKLYYDL